MSWDFQSVLKAFMLEHFLIHMGENTSNFCSKEASWRAGGVCSNVNSKCKLTSSPKCSSWLGPLRSKALLQALEAQQALD